MGGGESPFPSLMKRLFDRDEFYGTTEIFHYDEASGKSCIETLQDVEPILDQTKILRDDDEHTKRGIKNEMWQYAHIPVVVQLKWLQKYGPVNDPMKKGNEKLLFQLLNDPEWRYLKTTNKIHRGR
jgi:hypothetical protein